VNVSLLVLAAWFLLTVIIVLFGLAKQIQAEEKCEAVELGPQLYEQ
jgi:hypothetical protein